MMSNWVQDLRFACRQLVKNPSFSIIAIITLALGIGANTAIFSVINAVLLQPLPYPRAERIMALRESNGAGNTSSVAFPDYLDWRRDSTVFENLAVSRRDSRNLSGIAGREPERIGAAYVTANFFKVIGLPTRLGRTFTEEEDREGGPALAVISDRLWERAFQRDPAVLGRAVTFHNQIYSVIGVMPAEMTFPEETDVWFPIMRRNNEAWMNRANHPGMFVLGQLKPGVSLREVRTEMTAIATRLEKTYPDTNAQTYAVVVPLLENLVGEYRTNLMLLLGAVGLVLLIACANLANLFAARGASRAREFAIRSAVGASHGQIMRQVVAEAVIIALVGGGLGFLFALWSRDALTAIGPQSVSRFQEIHFDVRVLGFTLLLSGLTILVFSLWPAWRASRADVQLGLQAGSHGSSDTPAARRTRDLLVIGQVAVTLILLSAAGLILKSFARVQSLRLGYEPQGVLTTRVELPFIKYGTAEKIETLARALLEKVRTLPGVESAAISSNPPLLGGWQVSIQREGKTVTPAQRPSVDTEVVLGDYFATWKSALLRGRVLNERDIKSAPPVVVIDQTMAEQIFPNEDPIGKRLLMSPYSQGEEETWFEVVGVIAPMRMHGWEDAAPPPVAYFSLGQVDRQSLVLLVRGGRQARSLDRPIREIVGSLDPAQPVFDVKLMIERVRETWATQRLLSFLLLGFAVLALGLATVGLYGVLAYTGLKRMREIGVRIALGAQRGHIRGLILNHGLRLLLLGCVIGLAGAVATSHVLQSVLFQSGGVDPQVYFFVAAILLFATFFASWVPAQRACNVDPIITLREG